MKKGFTLAEALITLGIIGVVAAMTIPAVIVNVNQQEYRTALRKAVSTLNDAIALNIALDGKKPKSVSSQNSTGSYNTYNEAYAYSEYFQRHMSILKSTTKFQKGGNAGFYTNDGIKYEFPTVAIYNKYDNNYPEKRSTYFYFKYGVNEGCDDWTPCPIVVDVNGDKAPNQNGIDRFLIFIIDTKVVPFGYAAQKLMFDGDSN